MRVLGDIAKYLWSRDGSRLAIGTIADGEFLKRDGDTIVSAPGGGGSSDHATLSHLGWSSSGHTGTASRIAAFDSGGAATFWTGKDALASVLTTRGDLVTRDATEATRLPIGAANRLLVSDGTDPAWQPVSGDLSLSAGSWSVNKIGGTAVTVDTDGTLAANSDAKLATQKATKTYADAGYRPGGTDVAVADGGTGASTAAGARANLGVTAPMLFGLGADGALDFDGVGGTLAGATRSGTTYTAARDIRASAVTIRAGVTLKMAGFRLFISGTLAIEATGAISNSGSAGSGTSGGASPGTGSPGTIASTATAGGNGRGTSGAGTGTTGTSPSIGGRGGAGGAAAGGSPAGGTAGSITAPTAVQGDLRDFDSLIRGQLRSTSTGYIPADAGSGGGGGGHDGVSGNSGGGGGGGSALWIACDTINNAGKIQANGGDGAAATGTDNGGGGGGGGGWILLVYRATTGSGLGTVEANGGAGGAGSGGGSNGSNGSPGTTYTLQYT